MHFKFMIYNSYVDDMLSFVIFSSKEHLQPFLDHINKQLKFRINLKFRSEAENDNFLISRN